MDVSQAPNVGVIIGGCVGGLFGVIVIIVLVVLFVIVCKHCNFPGECSVYKILCL